MERGVAGIILAYRVEIDALERDGRRELVVDLVHVGIKPRVVQHPVNMEEVHLPRVHA
jgi:hypothetical protein